MEPTGWGREAVEVDLAWQNELQLGPRTCDSSEDLASAPTAGADRGCDERVVCTATQFETAPHTRTSVRECQEHTTCADSQYETKAAGTERASLHHPGRHTTSTRCTHELSRGGFVPSGSTAAPP